MIWLLATVLIWIVASIIFAATHHRFRQSQAPSHISFSGLESPVSRRVASPPSDRAGAAAGPGDASRPVRLKKLEPEE